jgi:hypothetical protein
MKVFICWSGERSRQFAAATSSFLKTMFEDAVHPEISTDIEKGAVWFDDLSDTLRQARVGLLCLTPEAIGSPWLHFEAGILAKALQDRSEPNARAEPWTNARAGAVARGAASRGIGTAASPDAGVASRSSAGLRIFPFLHGVESSALKGPLTAYQSTSTSDRDDVWRLVETIKTVIVESAAEADDTADSGLIETRTLRSRFEKAWSDLVEALKQIKPAKLTDVLPAFESLFRRKTFDESMYDCLNQGWLARYDGARSVETTLRSHQQTVRKACDRYVADVFDALITDVSAYAMCLSVQLAEPPSRIDPNGRVAFERGGVATACERLRKHVKELVARLIDEQQAPIFQEAFHFESCETSFEKKRLILRKAAEMRARKSAFNEEMNAPILQDKGDSPPKKHRCRDSEWDFDRITYYMWVEDTWADKHLATHLRCVRTELDREAAGPSDPFRLALVYALRVIVKGLLQASDPALHREASSLFQRVSASIEGASTEGLAELRQVLGDMQATLESAASSSPDPSA